MVKRVFFVNSPTGVIDVAQRFMVGAGLDPNSGSSTNVTISASVPTITSSALSSTVSIDAFLLEIFSVRIQAYLDIHTKFERFVDFRVLFERSSVQCNTRFSKYINESVRFNSLLDFDVRFRNNMNFNNLNFKRYIENQEVRFSQYVGNENIDFTGSHNER